MKKKSLILKLVMIAFLFSVEGCETERIIFKGPNFVRFTSLTDEKLESYSQPIQIEVHNGGPALDHDLIVNYSISGSARENVDYKIIGERGQVIIPQGKYFGNIEIQLINNANNILRSQNVIFTLNSTSNGERQIGEGVSGIGKSFTFTITDDCILGGTYIGEKDLITIPIQDIKITSQDCETYTLSNWDIYIFKYPEVRDLTFVDNGDNTLTIPNQKESTLIDSLSTINGFGTVNPVTREITMRVFLVDIKESSKAGYEFTLIPN